MTYEEMKSKYPEIIWEKAYNAPRILGYKKGDSEYTYQLRGSKIHEGDYTPEPYEKTT